MPLTSFRFDPSLTREFIDFGYSLYRRDARWIPPFRRTIARQFSPDYFFYKKAGNDHKHFLAYHGRRVVGRVSAMVNAVLKDGDGTAVGLIGFSSAWKIRPSPQRFWTRLGTGSAPSMGSGGSGDR